MSSSRQDALLAALQRKGAAVTTPAAAPVTKPATTAAPARRVGKPVQFWLHEEDRQMVRELAAWLAGQGIRPTDSMVVRAALRLAKPGGTFLDASRQALQQDGRLRSQRVK